MARRKTFDIPAQDGHSKDPGKRGTGGGYKQRPIKVIVKNRVARHDYDITDTWEAGIELTGSEVKSIREHPCKISDSFCIVRNGQVYLVGVHIHPYTFGGVWNVDPDRRRRLLLHRKQIDLIAQRLKVGGYALVPLEMYFDEHNRVKLYLGLGKGKKLYDKRRDMAKRDTDREIQRALKERSRYDRVR